MLLEVQFPEEKGNRRKKEKRFEATGNKRARSTDESSKTEFDAFPFPTIFPKSPSAGQDFLFLADEKNAYQRYPEDAFGVGLDAVIYERNKKVKVHFDAKISYMDSLGKESIESHIMNDYIFIIAEDLSLTPCR